MYEEKGSYLPWTITSTGMLTEGLPILLSTAHEYWPLSPPMTGVKISWVDTLLVCTDSLSLPSTSKSLPLTVQVTLGAGRPSNMQERVRLLPLDGVEDGLADGPLRMSAGSTKKMWFDTVNVHQLHRIILHHVLSKIMVRKRNPLYTNGQLQKERNDNDTTTKHY